MAWDLIGFEFVVNQFILLSLFFRNSFIKSTLKYVFLLGQLLFPLVKLEGLGKRDLVGQISRAVVLAV